MCKTAAARGWSARRASRCRSRTRSTKVAQGGAQVGASSAALEQSCCAVTPTCGSMQSGSGFPPLLPRLRCLLTLGKIVVEAANEIAVGARGRFAVSHRVLLALEQRVTRGGFLAFAKHPFADWRELLCTRALAALIQCFELVHPRVVVVRSGCVRAGQAQRAT